MESFSSAKDSSIVLLQISQKFFFLLRSWTWLYSSFLSPFVLFRDVCSHLHFVSICITKMSTLSIILWIIFAASLALYLLPVSLMHTPATCSKMSMIFFAGVFRIHVDCYFLDTVALTLWKKQKYLNFWWFNPLHKPMKKLLVHNTTQHCFVVVVFCHVNSYHLCTNDFLHWLQILRYDLFNTHK